MKGILLSGETVKINPFMMQCGIGYTDLIIEAEDLEIILDGKHGEDWFKEVMCTRLCPKDSAEVKRLRG
jgi:hypothetical protein